VQLAKAQLLSGLGVGRIQGQGVAVLLRQLTPQLLQAGEATPIVALGQGPLIAAASPPDNLSAG